MPPAIESVQIPTVRRSGPCRRSRLLPRLKSRVDAATVRIYPGGSSL
jgi:hypothetical protein